MAMNHFFYKIVIIVFCFLPTSFNLLFAQQDAKPDLTEALILCNTRDFIIDQFVGPGNDASEVSDGCLNGITETNTAWFSWGGGDQEGNITFTITPNNPNDIFGFTIFDGLPNLNDGTGKSAIGCVLPCRTGEVGLRVGDPDFNIDNCANAADGFIAPIIVETGRFYGLMIENTTSNGGFTISFGGNASFIGPTGEIMASAPEACFGTPLTFNDNVSIKDGAINSYTWTIENEIGQIEEIRTSQVPAPQTIDFQSIGTKNITLSVVSSLDAVANQTCTAKFELAIPINACCDSDNKVEITDSAFSEIKCPDDTNGAIDIEAISSNPNFPPMYFWSNSETTQDIADLTAGTYSVTVTNDAGCRDSLSHTFTIPNALTAVEAVTPPSCGGASDGVIAITASGGRMPYTYDYGDGSGFVINATLNGLDTGDYEVVVMDDSGCTTTISAIELDDKELTITFDTVAISCFGADDGQVIIADPPNGTAPFQYDFNDGNGLVNAAALTNLAPGSYTIDVFDAEGCTGNPIDFQLREPEELAVNISEARKFCFGQDDGYTTATVNGGIGTITFEWNNGAIGNVANDLLAGEYSVTATDENGCISSDTILLNDQAQLLVTIDTAIDLTCSSANDGQIVLDITGGVMPYEYSLDGINFQTGTTVDNLSPGDYDIVVKDNFGCIANTATITVSSPESLSFDVSSATDICYGESLTFTNTSIFSRGTPVSITWEINGAVIDEENPTVNFTQIGKPVVGLSIETDLGCIAALPPQELSISVNPCCDKPDNQINFLAFVEEPFCATSTDGRITLNASSNIPPITSIEWSNNETTDLIENLSGGEYSVTVSNDATCDNMITFSISEPAPISATLSLTEPTCNAAANGEISITASGGTVTTSADYEFDFGNGFSTNNTSQNLMVDTYSIIVRDENNCMESFDTILAVSAGFEAITATINITEPSCDAATNGAISVNASGNGGNFQYDFGNGFSNQNDTTGLIIGNYSITIQDRDNCSLTIDTSLTVPIGFEAISAVLNITQPTCDAATNGIIIVAASGNGGNFQYNFGNGFSNQNDTTGLSIGNYTITIQDGDNCTLTKDTTLAVPAGFEAISANLNINQPSCEEGINGAISVTASGNGGNFQYNFGNGFSNQNDTTSLMIGNYSVTIQDGDNCSLTKDTSLSAPPDAMPVQATLQTTQPSCSGGTDGSITVTPLATSELGTDIMNYEFDFGNGNLNSNVVNNLSAGFHLVVIRDINNCSLTLDTTLTELVLQPTSLVTRPTCYGLSDGSVEFNIPSPGQGPFLYDYGGDNFQDETALMSLEEGTYNIRIQDANLCLSETLEIIIDQPDSLTLTVNGTDISCFGANDGRIVADVIGGVGNFTYNWNNNQTSNIASMLNQGDYFVEVQDGNSCSKTSTMVTIMEPAELFASIAQIDNVLCFGETNGVITVDASGGTGPYEYSLDGIIYQAAATISNLPAGDYTAIVKDSRNCEISTENAAVVEPEEFIVTAAVDNEVTKLGFSVNLSADANATTTAAINYIWNTPDSTICNNCQSFETVPPGSTTFTVIAINADNCQATDEVKVVVSLDRPVYIPNVFSPNGDGINDEFFIPFSPSMTAIEELRIIDRSGALVFEAFDIKEGEELTKAWDGTINGQKFRQGVFVILAQISFVDNQTLPYQSDVTIITSN